MEADSPIVRRSQRSGMRPLRRTPKALDAEPTVYRPSGSGAGVVLTADPGRSGHTPRAPQGATAPGMTGEDAQQVLVPQGEVDEQTIRRAQEIASRLSLIRPQRRVRPRRGLGELVSVPFSGASDDIDMDATLEALVAEPVPRAADVVVRERLRTRRAVVLAVDVSGSMRGERVRTAAATVGALAAELSRDDLAVIAFWSDAAVLVPLGERVAPRALLETLVRIPAQGLTNVSFPLELAQRQLAGVAVADARVLLLSDCVHNAGPDPRLVAARLPRLDVLLDTSGEKDVDLGRELAHRGHGRLALVRDYRDVGPAVSRLFAP